MSTWTLYFNPKCGSCRKARALLEAAGIRPRIVEYLKTPPTRADLEGIIAGLDGDAEALIRKKEPAFEALGQTGPLSRSAVIDAILRDPILLQRPIVVKGTKALIARPPERVQDWLSDKNA